MSASLTFHIEPVELVQSLKRDAATFFVPKLFGDFLPRPALLALLANEVNERLNTTAIGTSASLLLFIFGFRIHAENLIQRG